MKFKVGRDKLLDVIRKVQSVIDRKTTSTILSNVLVSTDDDAGGEDGEGTIVVEATDFETSFRGSIHGVAIGEKGRFVVNGKSFYEILRTLGDKDVQIELGESRLSIKAGRSSFQLATFPAEDYPKIPDFGAVDYVGFDAAVFQRMIRSTMLSISADHSRPNLNGVFFTMSAGEAYDLTMVSTDGHRLSKVDVQLPKAEGGLDVSGSAIIHRKGLNVMKSMLESSSTECEVGFDDRNVIFRVDNATVSIRPIEETFPEYRNVIPKDFPISIALPRKPLEEMIRRVSVLNSPQVKAIKVRVAPGVLEAVSVNPELGEGRDEMAVGYDGTEVAAAFNYQFFLETLSVVDEGQIALEFIDSISACRIVPIPEEGAEGPAQDALFIIMPMRM
jgi:DNA polymerase III subunit beta